MLKSAKIEKLHKVKVLKCACFHGISGDFGVKILKQHIRNRSGQKKKEVLHESGFVKD